MNTDELDSAILRAEVRVLNIQAKLHRWATNPTGLVESPVLSNAARRVREAGRGNPLVVTPAGRPGPTSPGVETVRCGFRFVRGQTMSDEGSQVRTRCNIAILASLICNHLAGGPTNERLRHPRLERVNVDPTQRSSVYG